MEKGVRVMSPDTIAVGVFSMGGTLLGTLLGLFGERLVRRIGEVRCDVDSWDFPDIDHSDRRDLQVTFLNRKEVPVTVRDMRVNFYSEGRPLEGWVRRPQLWLVDESDQRSTMGALNLFPHEAVVQTIRVFVLLSDPNREVLAKADRAEFVANIVGTKDVRKPLTPPWWLPRSSSG